jgi:hypothetical protein
MTRSDDRVAPHETPDALITLAITINRYNDLEIDIVGARRLIMPLFGVKGDDCAHRDLIDDLDRLLDQLHGGLLSPDEVINEVAPKARLSSNETG